MAENGVFLGYAARLRRKGFRLGYSSTLVRLAGRALPDRIALRCREPGGVPGELRWRALGCEGTWKASAPPITRTLLESGGGRIEWECLAPRAEASIRLSGGQTIAGCGYVERLTLTIRPEELPMEELRWGRFHASGETLVWIDWKGPEPRRWVFRNGEEAADARVTDGGIRFGRSELRIGEGKILREGPLVSSALARWPLRWLLPRRVLAIHETKAFGPARLSTPGRAPLEGTALHEVVRWP